MEDRTPVCPYCEINMERGFVLDFAQAAALNSTWQAGEPTPQTFFGLKTGAVKLDKQHMLQMATYRCPDCGYLESYARRSQES